MSRIWSVICTMMTWSVFALSFKDLYDLRFGVFFFKIAYEMSWRVTF